MDNTNNTQVWMTGSYTTGVTHYSHTEQAAQAIANDPLCYEPSDPFVFIENVTPIEQSNSIYYPEENHTEPVPNYTVIYDYLGEESWDYCSGITEQYATHAEAAARVKELSTDPYLYHITIV